MENKLMDINLWEVISCKDERENSSFYKTVLLNSKAIAIKIDQKEFKSLAQQLWPAAINSQNDVAMI